MATSTPTQTKPVEKSTVFDPPSLAELLKEAVPGAVVSSSSAGIALNAQKLIEAVAYLKNAPELGYDYLNQVTAVDWPDRFEVIYNLTSISRGGPTLPLRVSLTDKENPNVPSLTPLYAGADLQEREVYDLMGIQFLGHPNLRRIFMWEGFEGHPLRKDYKEPYWEQEKKPFDSRWDQGHHVIAEDRNPWHDNVRYPLNFDAVNYQPPREIVRVVPSITEGQKGPALRTQPIVVNLGPQHPSTHGVFRMRVTIDGETIMAVEPVFGYMHRNHEKIGERNTYIMNFPFCDRLDYLTGMTMEHGYALAVEKLMGIKPPERTEYIRVIMDELTRIQSHMFGGIGQLYSDLGAFFTPILYGIEERELILDIFEATAGSRMMCNYMRFGGVWRDLPEGTLEVVKELAENRLPRVADELESYLVHNEIFDARARNVGVLTAEQAINLSASGPFLRASGVNYDIRRTDPYSIYDRFDFNVITGSHGDVYDRMVVRINEIRESCKILRQAVRDIPDGEIQTGKKNYSVRVPKGDVYAHIEAPRGEFGWYLASHGSGNPYRYHVRAGDFVNLGTLEQMSVGHKIGDLVAILGAVDIIMGSVDR
jgi:NADH:ubiquinone oxidoreductase subunit D/NADH:ubiquinone oxidoreductase subunit C